MQQLNPSWVLGPDSVTQQIPGPTVNRSCAFVAEVVIHAVNHAARDSRRLVFDAGETRALRELSGTLLWLEGGHGYALRQHGFSGTIVEVAPEVEIVIPSGIGMEALAVVGLQSLCDWVGGRPSTRSQDGRLHIDSNDWGPLIITLSKHGSIRNVQTDTTPPQSVLTVVREQLVRPQAEWFQPVDLDLTTGLWPR